MTDFTPIPALLGGALLGAAALILLKFNGRIAGISGIVKNIFKSNNDNGWRYCFIAGIILSPLFLKINDHENEITLGASWTVIIIAGLLVGLGSALGSGCTSGHGICGLGRLSKRSIIATLTFMSTAVLTVFVMGFRG